MRLKAFRGIGILPFGGKGTLHHAARRLLELVEGRLTRNDAADKMLVMFIKISIRKIISS
jgi:hypothetical protein